MPVSRPLGRARSKGSLVAKPFQPVKAAQKPDQPDRLNGFPTVNLIADSGNCYLNQRMVLCLFCRRRRLCASGTAAAQSIVLDDVSSIMLIALEALYQTIQLVLSKSGSMGQCSVSPNLRSHYLGWLDMYYDTHHLHSPPRHPREKATSDMGIVNGDRDHSFAVNIPVGWEHINERLNCLLLMRVFHRPFKTGISVRLDSPTSNLLFVALGPIELYIFANDQQQAYAALSGSVKSTRCSTGNLITAGRTEKGPKVLQIGGPPIGHGNVPITTRSVLMLRDMKHSASCYSFQLHSVLQQQNAFVHAKIIWPGISSIHWTRESFIHRRSSKMARITSLVQDGDGATNRVGGYSNQGQERHQRDTVQRQRSSTWPPALIRKRQVDSEESQDEDKRKRSGPGSSQKRRRLDNEKTLRFACPFFKYSPSRFADERACCGPGWSTVNRVKEHLYRRHSLPDYQCTRCYSNFKTNEELQDHSRQLQPCEIQDKPGILNGLDQEILSRLKMRPKKPSPISSSLSAEEQKWYNMFSIIFPDHALVPSPYYEPEDKGFSSLPSEAVAEEIFRKNLQETLPTWILTDSTIRDSIMHGSISAFNKTFTAIHGQGTTSLPDAPSSKAANTSTKAGANIDRRSPISCGAIKAENETVDDSSMSFFLVPGEDYMGMFDNQYDHSTQSSTFFQTSEDKTETSELPVQPLTHIHSWQPGSLPPPCLGSAADVPTFISQLDWSLQDDAIGHQDRNTFDKG